MSVTYTWSIPNNGLYTMNTNGNANTVTMVQYSVSGTDGTNTANYNGSTQITYNSNNPFIQFSDLSQNIVISWIQSELGTQKITMIQNSLTNQLNRMANPPALPVQVSAPWSANT